MISIAGNLSEWLLAEWRVAFLIPVIKFSIVVVFKGMRYVKRVSSIFPNISLGRGSEFLKCNNPRADDQNIWPLLWLQENSQWISVITDTTREVVGSLLRWDQFTWHGQIR